MRAIIFANGIIDPEQQPSLDILPGDVVIAADGGVRNSLLCGIRPDIVICDLDSITDQEKKLLSVDSLRFISFPEDKDQTDLELALDYAIHFGAEEVLLLGLLGGRLDQTLANLLLLSKDAYSTIKIVISASLDTGHLLRDQDAIILEADIGDIVSLIPLSLAVSGVIAVVILLALFSLGRYVPRGTLIATLGWLLYFPLVYLLIAGTKYIATLPPVASTLWGGLMLTLMLAVVGNLCALPLGIQLALGRRSKLPVIRTFALATSS